MAEARNNEKSFTVKREHMGTFAAIRLRQDFVVIPMVCLFLFVAVLGSASVRTTFRISDASAPLIGHAESDSPLAAKAGAELIKVGEYTLAPEVAKHLADVSKAGELVRPYLSSPSVLKEIMAAGKPIADPRGVVGAVKWIVPGTVKGSQGIWELVVIPKSKTIIHWLFRSTP